MPEGPSPASKAEQSEFLAQLAIYLEAFYPGCRSKWRRRLIDRARRHGHRGRLGEVAGILVHNFIRHERTDYERLMRINGRGRGLARDEARMVVANDVNALMAEWQKGSPEADLAYQEFARQVRARRRALGEKRHKKAAIDAENAAITAFLIEWLWSKERRPWWWSRRYLMLPLEARARREAPCGWRRVRNGREPAPQSWWERTTPRTAGQASEGPFPQDP